MGGPTLTDPAGHWGPPSRPHQAAQGAEGRHVPGQGPLQLAAQRMALLLRRWLMSPWESGSGRCPPTGHTLLALGPRFLPPSFSPAY